MVTMVRELALELLGPHQGAVVTGERWLSVRTLAAFVLDSSANVRAYGARKEGYVAVVGWCMYSVYPS